ncbi:hypothetical protein C8R30_101139 [Nitrosomonas nitrosa]|uniref:hypothetical protein n=1 Tax=Nitrosomonas nitrosa TaxID=52442 RepID=UPI000D318AE4|nr:hypothetical protein [Nitrosomonas nitrosa]PTR04942.1 hypothetical protein C8R30_101139 [Nitrosomonas nitrosa]
MDKPPCPLSPVDVNDRDWKIKMIEDDIVSIKSEIAKNNVMLEEVHEKIVKGGTFLNGFKYGGITMLTVVIIFFLGLISLLTGKISFSDFLKIVG